MPEFLQANESEVNQLAKKHLKSLGEKVYPDCPYSLQLMDWALEKGGLQVEHELLSDMHQALYGWDPQKVNDLLEGSEGESAPLLDEESLKSPKKLAWKLWDQLDSRLSAAVSSYPKASLPI
jgi:hypothetical protein